MDQREAQKFLDYLEENPGIFVERNRVKVAETLTPNVAWVYSLNGTSCRRELTGEYESYPVGTTYDLYKINGYWVGYIGGIGNAKYTFFLKKIDTLKVSCIMPSSKGTI